MEPFDQMELKRSEFTKTDEHIYECIMSNVDAVFRFNSMVLAKKYDVSQAALTRFCQRLGYRGYSDFSAALYLAKKAENTRSTASESVIEEYCDLIRKIPSYMADQDVHALVERLCQSRNIYTAGVHRSSFPAQQLAYNLQSIGVSCYNLGFDNFGTLSHLFSSEDTIILFSAKSTIFKNIVEELMERDAGIRPTTILVCVSPKHPLRSKVDQVFIMPNWRNQHMKHYLETQISIMIFVDLLTALIADELSTSGQPADSRWNDRLS